MALRMRQIVIHPLLLIFLAKPSFSNGFAMVGSRQTKSTGGLLSTTSDEETKAAPLMTKEEQKQIEESSIFYDSSSSSATKAKLSEKELIQLAKRFLVYSNGIGANPDHLSESFVFEGPVVGPFGKQQFLDAIGRVDFALGFPDWNGQFYGFHVDPFQKNRVWYMARGEGTNTGPFPTEDLPATNKKVVNPPQTCSLTFDDNGLVTKYTIGYVADRSIGNTGGLGGLYGILWAIGRPLPFPEAQPWKQSPQYTFFVTASNFLSRLFG